MRIHQAILLSVLILLPVFCFAATSSHSDPIAPVILGVTTILFCAILGRFSARKLGLPSVVGEVTIGILIGTAGHYLSVELIILLREGPAIFQIFESVLMGSPLEKAVIETVGQAAGNQLMPVLQGPNGGILLQVAHVVDVFSRYGIIFLLFLVGLDSSLTEMRTVGYEAARIALIGVVAPIALGVIAISAVSPELTFTTIAFMAATLGATSIGITASVLQELGRQSSDEGRLILGAAVIDDILGLILLTIISGIAISGAIELSSIAQIIIIACVFLLAAFTIGPTIVRLLVHILSQLDIIEAKMFTSFMFVMLLAWLANMAGLATIIGAFAAGIILNERYFNKIVSTKKELNIKELIMPLEVILVPIFFVLIGIQVKLELVFSPSVAILGGLMLIAAIIGKVVSGWGAKPDRSRLFIGLGMMPRGEVGLIFATIGKSLGVISDELFAAIVLVVITTTLLAPPLMKARATKANGS